ncbi:MAG TPA: protein phosphatase 2C domain-containing protein [Candidatus Eisenbacteria bacterium]|nr:protein phosphatase 2C domain-containing protein [Candidatus Eisenbacteria bacterium]
MPAQLTDRGRVRENNEDAMASRVPAGPAERARRGCFFAVADGLGGLSRGEVASRIAVETAAAAYDREPVAGPWLREAALEANRAVFDANRPTPSDPMATTLTLGLLTPDLLRVAHVGDCRLYRLRGNSFAPLTTDHAESRHVLTRALGTAPAVEADYREWPVDPEDRYLLCSDGLYSAAGDDEMGERVAGLDAESACRELVDLANRRGGPDNITVIIFRASEAR